MQIEEADKISYSNVLAINLSAKEGGIAVYPVPATDKLTVSIKNSALVNTEVQFISPDGRVLQKIKLQLFQQNINIGHLSPGVYYLKTADGNAYRIVKQ